jgi:hypothetical protein
VLALLIPVAAQLVLDRYLKRDLTLQASRIQPPPASEAHPPAATAPPVAAEPAAPARVLAISNISRADIAAKLSGIPELMRSEAGTAYVGKRVRWQGKIRGFMRLGGVQIHLTDSFENTMWASLEESARVRLLAIGETITVDGIISEPQHFTLHPAELIEE